MADGDVDPALLAGWLRGRSLARRLPAPIAEADGWRVETGAADEVRRFVFARPSAHLRALGEALTQPRIALKLCASHDILLDLLPARWVIQSPAWLMTNDRPDRAPASLPDGFRFRLVRNGDIIDATIATEDGRLAASGHAALSLGYFVFDRIVTEVPFRRLGLGRALMTRLAASASADATHVLTATEMGRALYLSLGWHERSPYSTALVPN